MSKIEKNKEKKRLKILAAAKGVFLSEGFITATMDVIASKAKVTKQTVYRYYPSKLNLFQATLEFMGEAPEADCLHHLTEPEVRKALYRFAEGFIRFHLSPEHLATYRLLVTESGKAPEIVSTFFSTGPSDTNEQLKVFFTERLGQENPEVEVRLFTAMLLALRDGSILGMGEPTEKEILEHAQTVSNFLLSGLSLGGGFKP